MDEIRFGGTREQVRAPFGSLRNSGSESEATGRIMAMNRITNRFS